MNSYLGVLKKGAYVKMTVKNVQYKHFRNFTPEHPVVLARINPGEDNFGFIKARIKKHRWYNSPENIGSFDFLSWMEKILDYSLFCIIIK